MSSPLAPIVVALAILGSASSPYSAKVIGVADGDTLTVLRDDRTQVRIRLWGVDAPESGQDWGDRSRRRLVETIIGKTVRVEPVETDRYGRTVARIRLGDVDVGTSQVRDGMAWWYRRYAPADTELARAESESRKASRGLWSSSNPVAPWDWRDGAALPPSLAGKYVASRRSDVYHVPGCKTVVRIAEANRITFESAESARKSGRTQAKDCR